ncbi:MAG: hypothetical protein D6743_01390 [Calditrichaeota bacterium]|nr:MAG: hypothetical protein D6743_01390 [Calditrichota bacterium]
MTGKIKTGVSYFGNRNPRHFVSDLEEILTHNCSFIVHTFSENDQQFYKETVGELVALSKDAGLECYLDPWGVGRVFGGEAYSGFALKHLETCQVLPDGEVAPAVCFNHDAFREFMLAWIADAAELGADVLFWDEPHFFFDLKQKDRFPVWYCRCNTCNALFRKIYHKEIYQGTMEEVVEFRDHAVVSFLAELFDTTHSHGMKNALCLLPFRDPAIGVTDWAKVAALPALDIFGTDPYWLHFGQDVQRYVGDFSREVCRLCGEFGKEAQIWIQAYNIPAGCEHQLKEAVAVAYAEGVRNFAAWSFYGTAYMSYIRSDNPKLVWDVLGDVYGELRRGEWE